MAQSSQFQLDADTRRLEELEAQLVVLQDQEVSLENANRLKGGSIDGDGGEVVPLDTGIGTGDEIEAIADRFKTEEQLLTDKLNRELELIGENKELRLQLEDRYIEDLADMEEAAETDRQSMLDKANKKKEVTDKKSNKIIEDSKSQNVGNMLSIADSLVGGNEKIGKAIFLAQKALGISDVFIQTQRASMRALAELGPIAGPPAAAAIETKGYISMAAMAASAIGSVSGGGSGGGGGSSGGGSSASDTGASSNAPEQQNFEAEMSGLEIDDASSQGSGVQTIRFAVDSGDELIDAISSALNKANNEGR